jgi:hypothetical protein
LYARVDTYLRRLALMPKPKIVFEPLSPAAKALLERLLDKMGLPR